MWVQHPRTLYYGGSDSSIPVVFLLAAMGALPNEAKFFGALADGQGKKRLSRL
jgi:hypothetical protein